jgi:asparagine synthase (glutamine-hydrolysing)
MPWRWHDDLIGYRAMCGLAGFVSFDARFAPSELAAHIATMTESLAHRGPDSNGTWVDAAAGVALGHTRLAVIDLSAGGHQPMISADGRYVIIYNGESYNHAELRRMLADRRVRFRGHSDTEVILEACAAWGVDETVKRIVGMFAFVLWDRRDRTVTLARDRFGVKPLYWGNRQGRFVFASELKALRALPGWTVALCRPALVAYLRLGYVPAPLSIYEGILKLQPGCVLTLRIGDEPRITRYWDTVAEVRQATSNGLVPHERAASDELEALLRDSVRRRMIADVSLGSFLSGGIDSSLVTALMQAESTRPVKTFSIGFHDRGIDEAREAKAVARHLGTDHTELYVEPAHAMATVPQLPEWFDEPFADPSQIPTYLLSELTRRHVTVALTGDGGDELFMGYDRYRRLPRLWNLLRLMNEPMRRPATTLVRAGAALLGQFAFANPALAGSARLARTADLMHRVGDFLPASSPDTLYWLHHSRWEEPDELLGGGTSGGSLGWTGSCGVPLTDFAERMQLYDTLWYLPDDILTKVDRASMAVALEARVPLLDHRLAQFAWRLPRQLREQRGRGKWLLRRVLHRFVPPALVERPKRGFWMPIGHWLRGPLRDWAEELLSEQRLLADGLFAPQPIRARWLDHLAGRRNWEYCLWTLLMFQCWKKRWLPT